MRKFVIISNGFPRAFAYDTISIAHNSVNGHVVLYGFAALARTGFLSFHQIECKRIPIHYVSMHAHAHTPHLHTGCVSPIQRFVNSKKALVFFSAFFFYCCLCHFDLLHALNDHYLINLTLI